MNTLYLWQYAGTLLPLEAYNNSMVMTRLHYEELVI